MKQDLTTRYGVEHGQGPRRRDVQQGCWEEVDGGMQRIEVPSGWLYRYTHGDHPLVFVPLS